MKSVDDVVGASFANGPPDKILHAVGINVEAGYDPLAHRGSLQVVSPAEFVLGAFKACARDIDKKVPDATLRKRRSTMLSVQFDFVLVPRHAVSMYAMHLREWYLDSGETVGWTVYQRVQMVVRERWVMDNKSGRDTSAAKVSHRFEKWSDRASPKALSP